MKLLKSTEKETKESKIVITETKTDFVGLKAFMDKYPDNATTSLVYFEDGMTPVESPFTSIIALSKTIVENDPVVIQRLTDCNDYGTLEDFMVCRKNSILYQFKARCNFLSRSLMMNVEQKIFEAIMEVCGSLFVNSNIDETSERLAAGFYTGVTKWSFGNTKDDNADFLTTYSFNTITIPGLVAEFYDKYDATIVNSVSHFTSKRETAEELHMQILKRIVPVFEMLKSQMEWLNYMLRSEAETIYRPMAMLPVETVLDDYYKTEYAKLEPSNKVKAHNYRTAITQALDAGDFDKAKELILNAEKEGIDTGITMKSFDYRSDTEKLQDKMIEAAKENPGITTTVF